MSGPLSEDTRAAMRRMMARYPQPRSALLPMLYLVQAEHGYVSDSGIGEIAGMLDLTKAEVASVSTFYTMLKRRPVGRWLLSVCTQPPCALRGALGVKDALERELGIGCGETTPDGVFTLEEVECLCICDGAAVVGVNYENYERVTPDHAIEMVHKLRAGGPLEAPHRGEIPAPGPDAHRELSGLGGPHPPGRPG